MRLESVAICRSDGVGEGIGIKHSNIQRGPYGVKDRLGMAGERRQ